ncbi:MAG: hypothetical protein EPO09_15845 [Aquabacterium sp.]|uniref:hypothetical protein n=1 Tax=Aquabacterium sp. TaxID=1872578 RepID=UPI0011FCC890|nr:hypothetical protein [Aquabacterium sp.]TAK91646.1 MAG: hypothetical protein EPO09_15845 [Aquabacterium sp.]
MTKGRNTFEGYQAAKQEGREKLLIQYLEQLKTSRVKFQHVTGLAEMVATHITHQQQKPCNKATLLRNKRYKSLLLTFMAAHLGGGTQNLKLRDVGDEKAKALVTTVELKAANLEREVTRLKRYVEHLQKDQSAAPAALPAPDAKAHEQELHDIQLKYVRTCQALHGVLRHFESFLAVNAERRQIIDLTKRRNNVVVDADFAEPFVAWLKDNEGAGGAL